MTAEKMRNSARRTAAVIRQPCSRQISRNLSADMPSMTRLREAQERREPPRLCPKQSLPTRTERFARLFYQEAKMLACKGIFAMPSITRLREAQERREPPRLCPKQSRPTRAEDFARLFYQEAKMLACKGIFAMPSITRLREAQERRKPPRFCLKQIRPRLL